MKTIDLDLNKQYFYSEYLTWMDNVRRELLNGFIKMMSPSASSTHQRILLKLIRKIDIFLDNKTCEVFVSPSDVRFPESDTEKADNQICTVVQPDIYVVCDPSKIDEKGCLGAPDFIIEIVSRKNAKRDVKEKFELYQKYGVREYWIVNPNDENINVFILNDDGKYQLVGIYAENDKIPVHIFNGELVIDLTEVFIHK